MDQTYGRFFHLVKLSKKTVRQRSFKKYRTMFQIFFVKYHKKLSLRLAYFLHNVFLTQNTRLLYFAKIGQTGPYGSRRV